MSIRLELEKDMKNAERISGNLIALLLLALAWIFFGPGSAP